MVSTVDDAKHKHARRFFVANSYTPLERGQKIE